MKTFFNRVIASVLLLSITTVSAFAGKISNDWKRVKKESGSNVIVLTKNRQQYEEKLQIVNDDSLLMKINGAAVKINREDVAEVWIKRKSTRKATLYALGFAGAGFLTGALIGRFTANDHSGFGIYSIPIGGAIGAAGGLVTGAVVGNALEKEVKKELIYQAP